MIFAWNFLMHVNARTACLAWRDHDTRTCITRGFSRIESSSIKKVTLIISTALQNSARTVPRYPQKPLMSIRQTSCKHLSDSVIESSVRLQAHCFCKAPAAFFVVLKPSRVFDLLSLVRTVCA